MATTPGWYRKNWPAWQINEMYARLDRMLKREAWRTAIAQQRAARRIRLNRDKELEANWS